MAARAVAANSLIESGEDDFRIRRCPIVTSYVPHDGRESEFPRGAQDIGTAGSVGRAEVADALADDVFDDGAGRQEFFAHAGRGAVEKPGMGHGVVADEVSCGVDSAGEVAALADEASDEEECGADIVASEEIEQLFGAGVVGAIVVGDGIFIGVAPGEDGPAEELGLGPHGGVVVSANGEAGGRCSACDGGEH